MLSNYSITQEGIIKQLNVSSTIYDSNYINKRYNTLEALNKGKMLNSLRLGFVLAVNRGEYPESIMDFGYGNGSFLNLCKDKIYECSGFDISNITLPEGIIEGCLKDKYETITFFDSLEHCESIYFIEDLKCKNVVISVPDCKWKSDEDDIWFRDWKHRRENEHLWHFSRDSMLKFMNNRGFELILMSNIEDCVRIDIRYTPNIMTYGFRKK